MLMESAQELVNMSRFHEPFGGILLNHSIMTDAGWGIFGEDTQDLHNQLRYI